VARCVIFIWYLGRRLKAHAAGNGARYTRSRLPVALVYRERARDRSAALRREAALKRLTRAEKLALIAPPERRLARNRLDEEAERLQRFPGHP